MNLYRNSLLLGIAVRLNLSGLRDPTGSNATADIAFWVTGNHKSLHYGKGLVHMCIEKYTRKIIRKLINSLFWESNCMLPSCRPYSAPYEGLSGPGDYYWLSKPKFTYSLLCVLAVTSLATLWHIRTQNDYFPTQHLNDPQTSTSSGWIREKINECEKKKCKRTNVDNRLWW